MKEILETLATFKTKIQTQVENGRDLDDEIKYRINCLIMEIGQTEDKIKHFPDNTPEEKKAIH